MKGEYADQIPAKEVPAAGDQERTATKNEATFDKNIHLANIAAGIVHDINNPLGAMKASVDLITKLEQRILSQSLVQGEGLGKLMELMKSAIAILQTSTRRIEEVMEALEQFANLDRAEVRKLDLNESIRHMILLLQPRIVNHVTIRKDLNDLPPLWCSPTDVYLMIMNLLLNALESSPRGGEVDIETNCHDNVIRLFFRNKGQPIPPDMQHLLFRPMFSTKPGHAGMGLSLVQEIAQKYHGTIGLTQNEIEGITFIVTLPTSAPA